MRRVALLVLGLTLAGLAPVRADPLSPVETRRLTARRHAAVIERDVGLAFAALGLAVLVAGGATIAYAYAQPKLSFEDGQSAVLAGGIMLGVGAALLVPGTVMPLDGQIKIADSDWRLRSPVVLPFVAPLGGGALAGALFRF